MKDGAKRLLDGFTAEELRILKKFVMQAVIEPLAVERLETTEHANKIYTKDGENAHEHARMMYHLGAEQALIALRKNMVKAIKQAEMKLEGKDETHYKRQLERNQKLGGI